MIYFCKRSNVPMDKVAKLNNPVLREQKQQEYNYMQSIAA